MNFRNSSKVEKIGISLTEEILHKIENERGDISRSRFVLRLLELGFRKKENSK